MTLLQTYDVKLKCATFIFCCGSHGAAPDVSARKGYTLLPVPDSHVIRRMWLLVLDAYGVSIFYPWKISCERL